MENWRIRLGTNWWTCNPPDHNRGPRNQPASCTGHKVNDFKSGKRRTTTYRETTSPSCDANAYNHFMTKANNLDRSCCTRVRRILTGNLNKMRARNDFTFVRINKSRAECNLTSWSSFLTTTLLRDWPSTITDEKWINCFLVFYDMNRNFNLDRHWIARLRYWVYTCCNGWLLLRHLTE